MKKDTIQTRKRKPKGGSMKTSDTPISNNISNCQINNNNNNNNNTTNNNNNNNNHHHHHHNIKIDTTGRQ